MYGMILFSLSELGIFITCNDHIDDEKGSYLNILIDFIILEQKKNEFFRKSRRKSIGKF